MTYTIVDPSISLFTKAKELRSTANMFVVNLAFSDFCMMVRD
jgi:r-opsin